MKVINTQASHTYGVLDPLVAERRDTKFVAGSLASASNLFTLPQGGYADRGGTSRVGILRRPQNGNNVSIIRRYTRGADSYQLVLTPGWLDVYKSGELLYSAPAPWMADIIKQVKIEAAYDTVLFFHQEFAPRRLMRQGSDTSWDFGFAIWKNVPLIDLGGVYTNGVNEQQDIWHIDFTPGATIELTLEGETTVGVRWDGSTTNFANAVKLALEELSNISPGLTVSYVGDNRTRVHFTGAGNKARDWPVMTVRMLTINAFASIRTVVKGKKPGEPIMSDAAGWPAFGRYAQQRLVLGGFKSRPGTFLASTTGGVFDLNMELEGATAAVMIDLDGEDTTIRDMAVSSSLVFFCDGSVWSCPLDTFSAESVPRLKRSDAPGADAAIQPLSLSNGLFYVQRGGQVLVQLNYSELEQNFLSDNASVLSAFLINRPQEMALRRATSGNDGDMLLFINEDGQLVSLTLMRSQEVSGFMPHATRHGKFHSLCVDADQTVWFVCEREINGQTELVLEKMETDQRLDSSVLRQQFTPSAILNGLEAFNGQQVWAASSGNYFGPFTVQAGRITLPVAVGSARVGYWLAPFATDPPFHPEEETRRPMARRKRVCAVTVSVLETSSIALAVNGGEPFDMPMFTLGETPLGVPPELRPVTGTLRAEGMPGVTEGAQVTVTQTRPGALTVRMLKKEIAV
jgi:hypothetical protein